MNKQQLPPITIVTATLGTEDLQRNLDSVAAQEYDGEVEHLIVFDGEHHLYHKPSYFDFKGWTGVVQWPYNTGHDGYNGHRIYGAATFLANNNWLIFLDEDNYLAPNHCQTMMESIIRATDGPAVSWAYSLRTIVDKDGNVVCNDECESLGYQKNVFGEKFVDVNCYLLPRFLAVAIAPYWMRRARNPNEQPEVDRCFSQILLNPNNQYLGVRSGEYSVFYKAGNTERSVKPEFFIEGNKKMRGMRQNGIV